MGSTSPQDATDDGWPWNCTRCGATMYHYAATCRECSRTERAALLADVSSPMRVLRTWVGWMRRQSYPGFVAKVAAIAGVELLLTTLWLAMLSSRALAVPTPL